MDPSPEERERGACDHVSTGQRARRRRDSRPCCLIEVRVNWNKTCGVAASTHLSLNGESWNYCASSQLIPHLSPSLSLFHSRMSSKSSHSQNLFLTRGLEKILSERELRRSQHQELRKSCETALSESCDCHVILTLNHVTFHVTALVGVCVDVRYLRRYS